MSKSRDTIPLGLNAIHDRLAKAREVLGDAPGEDKFGTTTLDACRKFIERMQIAILHKQVDDDEMRVSIPLPSILFQKRPPSDDQSAQPPADE